MASNGPQPVIGQYIFVPSPTSKCFSPANPEISVPKIVTSGKTLKTTRPRESTISPLSPEQYDANLEYMLTIDLPDVPSHKIPGKSDKSDKMDKLSRTRLTK